jgi:four helix bundle protein
VKDGDGLKVLQAAREFRDRVLVILTQLPTRDTLGLRSQLADAVRSVSSNISEGLGRGTRAEELQFFRVANGSLEEAQEGLRELVNTGLISRKAFYNLWNLSVAISKMLSRLISKRRNADRRK